MTRLQRETATVTAVEGRAEETWNSVLSAVYGVGTVFSYVGVMRCDCCLYTTDHLCYSLPYRNSKYEYVRYCGHCYFRVYKPRCQTDSNQ